ncbi:MAG: MFS transporter [Candidatus Zixiibacteriota bacterium]
MDEQAIQTNRYKFFTVGALGTFMATFDGSIVNVALPTIAEKLSCPVDVVAWVVLAYSLTLIALMLVFGAWTESKGYAFAYRFGYIFFLLGSLTCSLAWDIYALIIGRILQATGTAMFAAIGPGMVSRVFPANERGKGIGMMVMMVAAGFMVGPPVGGLMLGIWSWPSIFLVNLPVGLVGLYLVYRYFSLLPPPKSKREVRFPSAAAISTSLVAGIFALSMLNDHPFNDVRIWGLLLLSAAALLVFFRIESKPEKALIGLEIFRNRQFTTSILAQSTYFIASSGVLVLIPFYLERVKGLEPRQVGLFLIILPVLMFVLSPLAGRLSDRIGYRLLTSAGMLITGLGLVLLGRMDLETTNMYVVLSMTVIGVGVGLFSTPNSSALMGSVEASQQAVTSGILATNRNIGMSVGVGLSTAFYSFLENRNGALADPKLIFIRSYRPVIYFAVALTLVGVVFCLIRGNGENKAVDITPPGV